MLNDINIPRPWESEAKKFYKVYTSVQKINCKFSTCLVDLYNKLKRKNTDKTFITS